MIIHHVCWSWIKFEKTREYDGFESPTLSANHRFRPAALKIMPFGTTIIPFIKQIPTESEFISTLQKPTMFAFCNLQISACRRGWKSYMTCRFIGRSSQTTLDLHFITIDANKDLQIFLQFIYTPANKVADERELEGSPKKSLTSEASLHLRYRTWTSSNKKSKFSSIAVMKIEGICGVMNVYLTDFWDS